MSPRFTQTGLIEDLDTEDLKRLINAIAPRPPRGTMTVRQRHEAERLWYFEMGTVQLCVWAEYMRRNMGRYDTIVYEGAMIEWCLPELIRRLNPTMTPDSKDVIIQTLQALEEGRDVRW